MTRKELLATSAAVCLGTILLTAKPARADLPTFDVITHFLLTQAQNAISTVLNN